ncbi:DUF4912 domain-containing protein [Hyalangium rubrum]|uniref:DUF4912 domain-containing protein n=1 Tax=Hyalangium rubrum TaxID=3103134 RepID=A0ABU5GY77_9BACT|nr:DUF4912 domain-containing protein [Hyalangium sp. s54d21]MDY7224800.1 DUF4912 domain-containing protein [Hyalangium sp. s54d21]
MDELKSVTVSYLRDLARKYLGPGHSKLNKQQLIAALAQFVPALKKLAKLAGIALPTPAKAAPKGAATASRTFRGVQAMDKKPKGKKASSEKKGAERTKEPERKKAPEKKAEAKKAPEKKAEAKKAPEKKAEAKKAPEKKEPEKKASPAPARKSAPSRAAPAQPEDTAPLPQPAQVVNFPPRPRSYRSAERAGREAASEASSAPPETVHARPAEPLLEGFFVARVVGERELRRHHMTEDQAPRAVQVQATGDDENLGELPLDYGNDLAMALARDPHTLFISWDFSPAARARAIEGLDDPRAVLRVYDGDKLVRMEEFVLESRSFYIHGLPPGRAYRVEAHFVGRDGRSRRIGYSSHPVNLPQSGLSHDTSVRFMRMPPPPPPTVSAVPQPVPTPELVPAPPVLEAPLDEREYFTWERVALPGSADMADVLQIRRELIAREAGGPELTLGAVPEHMLVPSRPPGSSEQSAAMGGRAPKGVFEPLFRGGIRGGSSELSLGGGARGGSSEQIHWTPPHSGRGR